MPTTSARHAIAMRLAKAGKGKLGIPRSVGADFVAADRRAGIHDTRSRQIRDIAKRLKGRKKG